MSWQDLRKRLGRSCAWPYQKAPTFYIDVKSFELTASVVVHTPKMDLTNHSLGQRDAALAVRDYHSYQSRLATRIAKLRKKLGRATSKTMKVKDRPAITASDIAQNHDFAYLLLLEAERAWAHGMYLRSLRVDDSAAGMTGSTRKQVLSRLDKAYRYAKQLSALLLDQSGSKATDNDVAEVLAYTYMLAGAEEFEKQSGGLRSKDEQSQKERWHKCLVNFSAARMMYDSLYQATGKDIFKEALSALVDPSVRYVAYQFRRQRNTGVEEVVKRFLPSDDKDLIRLVKVLNPKALSEKASSQGV